MTLSAAWVAVGVPLILLADMKSKSRLQLETSLVMPNNSMSPYDMKMTNITKNIKKKMFLFPSLLPSIALTTYDRSSKWKPHIRVFDANRQPMYVVRGPCCWGCQNCFCTDDIDFPVSNGRSVGMVLLIKIHISLENFINLENWIIKKLYNYLIWLRIGDKHWFRCMVFFS